MPKDRAVAQATMKVPAGTTTEQRVLLVYRDALLRDVAYHLLRSANGAMVVHTCHLREFQPTALTEHRPTVIVADQMPTDLITALLGPEGNLQPSMRVVFVSLNRDDLCILEVRKRQPAGVDLFLDAVCGWTAADAGGQGEEYSLAARRSKKESS
ncbi:MAG: hypothetical protein RMM58_03670 [Chloroflexota bacterium]|nr:hypothetical protein [Chloroflexota bacterium]